MSSCGLHLRKGDRDETEMAFSVTAILGGGALTLLALVLVAYQYGNQTSIADIELAAGLGVQLAVSLP